MRARVILFEDDGTEIDSADYKIRDVGRTIRSSIDALQHIVNERDDFSWRRASQLLYTRLTELFDAINVLRSRMAKSDGLDLMEVGLALRDQLNTAPVEAALAEVRMKEGFSENNTSFVGLKGKLLPEKFYR